MFGLFYVFAHFVGLTVSGTKRSVENMHYKEQGWEKYKNGTDLGKHTYYDAEGKERDLTSNHIMFTYRKNGDLYIEDTKTFKVRNLSEEKREENIQRIKKENPSVKAVFYKFWDHSNSELRDGVYGIPGKIFKDVNNGQLYFERYITWQKNDFSKAGIRGNYQSAYFYLRVSDGKIVSISDMQIEEDKKRNMTENYDEFIKFFNAEQDNGGFIVRNRNRYAKSKTDFYLGNDNTCNNL